MRCYDVFNGDADGICALRQLRLAQPLDSVLVTGIKRDIELLARVPAEAGDRVSVLDISLERNRGALLALLARGVKITYFDHHAAGTIPDHPLLEAVIETSVDACTSQLVDRHLGGRFRAWAIAGCFGDNLSRPALELAQAMRLQPGDVERLRSLGECLNYNAYGETEADVMVHPAELYRIAARYVDPVAMARDEPVVARLDARRNEDLERALALAPAFSGASADIYILPGTDWSRRVSGTFANRLAQLWPQRAHAVLTPGRSGAYGVNVRTPSGRVPTAVDFCARYERGGGRALAAGIDALDAGRVREFTDAFATAWTA